MSQEGRVWWRWAIVLDLLLWLALWFAVCGSARAADDVSWSTPVFGNCSNTQRAGVGSTAAAAVNDLVAWFNADCAAGGYPNRIAFRSASDPVFANGAYSADGAFTGSGGVSDRSFPLTGTCVGGCTGVAGGGTGAASGSGVLVDGDVGLSTDLSQIHPNKAAALLAMFVAFCLGFVGGKQR